MNFVFAQIFITSYKLEKKSNSWHNVLKKDLYSIPSIRMNIFPQKRNKPSCENKLIYIVQQKACLVEERN